MRSFDPAQGTTPIWGTSGAQLVASPVPQVNIVLIVIGTVVSTRFLGSAVRSQRKELDGEPCSYPGRFACVVVLTHVTEAFQLAAPRAASKMPMSGRILIAIRHQASHSSKPGTKGLLQAPCNRPFVPLPARDASSAPQ